MDIKAKVEAVVKAAAKDKNFLSAFAKDPVKAVESVIGMDLPDDQINAVISEVKKRLAAEGLGKLDMKDVAGLAGSIFGKK